MDLNLVIFSLIEECPMVGTLKLTALTRKWKKEEELEMDENSSAQVWFEVVQAS